MSVLVRATVRSGSAPLSPHECAIIQEGEGVSNELFLHRGRGLTLCLIEGCAVAIADDFVEPNAVG